MGNLYTWLYAFFDKMEFAEGVSEYNQIWQIVQTCKWRASNESGCHVLFYWAEKANQLELAQIIWTCPIIDLILHNI